MITVGEYTTPSRAYIGRFNFKGQDQQNSLVTYQAVSVTACNLPKP